MKTIYLYLSLFLISFSFAQQPQKPQENQAPPKWVKKGLVTFLVNQSSFDNWIAGWSDPRHPANLPLNIIVFTRLIDGRSI